MTDNSLQAQFAAAAEQRAEQIRAARAAKLEAAQHKQERANQGTEFLRAQFDLLAADGSPEPALPSSKPDDEDVFSRFPRF